VAPAVVGAPKALSYVIEQAENLTGDLGQPFGPLPAALIN
jgi:hypothetical protein